MKRLARLFFLVWTVLLGSLAVLCLWSWKADYAIFFQTSVDFLGLQDKVSQIRTQVLPYSRFLYLRYLLTFIVFLGLVSLPYSWRLCLFVSKTISNFFTNLYLACTRYLSAWEALSLGQKWFIWSVFSFFLAILLWKVLFYAYWVDEVFSYVFLVKRGVLVSATYYPGPNNHLFFTIVSAFLSQCAGKVVEAVILMRLLAMSGVLCAGFVLFAWLLVRKGFAVASLALVLFALQSPVQMYGSLGRGYGWVMLFFLLAWIGFWEWQRQGRRFYLALGCMSSVAGFWVLPTFLYAFLAIFPFSKNKKASFWGVLGVFFCTLILYAPVVLLNGMEAVAGNSWLKVGKADFWQNFLAGNYWVEVVGFWGVDLPVWGAWLVLGTVLAVFSWAGKEWVRWFWRLFLVPVLMLCFQQVLPPARVWSYFAVVLAVALGLLEGHKRWLSVVFGLAFLGNLIFYFQLSSALPAHVQVARKIYEKNVRTVWANDDTYQMFVRYEYALRDAPVEVQTTCVEGRQGADILICSKSASKPTCYLPARYRLWWENAEVQVFEKIIFQK